MTQLINKHSAPKTTFVNMTVRS